MINKMYVIYDKVAKESGEVMLFKNDDVASRVFLNLLKKEISNGCKPNDYELRCVGKFDSEKACVYTTDIVTKEDGSKEYPECNYVVSVKFDGDVA